jgi:hypothetical protein
MALSMRTLLATDTQIPEAVQAGIASGDPDSAAHLMRLGVNECEAAELLDEPCSEPRNATDGPDR